MQCLTHLCTHEHKLLRSDASVDHRCSQGRVVLIFQIERKRAHLLAIGLVHVALANLIQDGFLDRTRAGEY